MTVLPLSHNWPWWEVTHHGQRLFAIQARTRAEAIRLAHVQLRAEGSSIDGDIDVRELTHDIPATR